MRLERPSLIGVIHLQPLPGSPGWAGDFDAVLRAAEADARAYVTAGFHAVVVENFGDTPFFPGPVPPETVAAMARAGAVVRDAIGPAPAIGFNVLRNDARSALALCAACGGSFIRVNVHTGAMVTDQGLIQGQAADTLRQRHALGLAASVAILADVAVKHAAPLAAMPIDSSAADTYHRGHADALIVTGSGTGQPTPLDRLRAVREAVPGAPLFAGSGVTAASVRDILAIADGVIVGSALKAGDRLDAPVDPDRAAAFARAAGL